MSVWRLRQVKPSDSSWSTRSRLIGPGSTTQHAAHSGLRVTVRPFRQSMSPLNGPPPLTTSQRKPAWPLKARCPKRLLTPARPSVWPVLACGVIRRTRLGFAGRAVAGNATVQGLRRSNSGCRKRSARLVNGVLPRAPDPRPAKPSPGRSLPRPTSFWAWPVTRHVDGSCGRCSQHPGRRCRSAKAPTSYGTEIPVMGRKCRRYPSGSTYAPVCRSLSLLTLRLLDPSSLARRCAHVRVVADQRGRQALGSCKV